MVGEAYNSIEHRRLLKLAREYRQQGYVVTMNPSPTDLPVSLAQCPLDLIAQRGGKTVAVEVRSRDTLTLNGEHDLRRISAMVNQLPDWEFELVVTNPRQS
jgi:hypothetical protein